MEKKYVTLFISMLILQFSNAQSDNVEMLMQPLLKKIELVDSLAYQELNAQLDRIEPDGLSLDYKYTKNTTNNWQLIGLKTICSSYDGLPDKKWLTNVSLYQSVSEYQTFKTAFILNKFNINEIDIKPHFIYEDGLSSDTSWTAFYYRDYLIITRQDNYFGGQIRSHYTETYYFKSHLALKTEFDNYLKNLLEKPIDTTLTLDPSFTYKYNFITQCDYHEGFSTDSYYDENFSVICVDNISKSEDLIKIVSKSYKLKSKEHTRLKNETKTKLPTFWCKLDLKFRAKFEVRKSNTSIISFNNGKYLIVRDIVLTDHRAQSRGFSCSYYLEKID